MARRLPASLELTISALAHATIVGLPAGIAAAVLANSWFDHLVRVIATLGVAMPAFFTGLMLVYVFYFDLAGRRRRSAGSAPSRHRRHV